ncbi:hypothetical protein QTP70_015077, partial [Hemibagrus guttatus]
SLKLCVAVIAHEPGEEATTSSTQSPQSYQSRWATSTGMVHFYSLPESDGMGGGQDFIVQPGRNILTQRKMMQWASLAVAAVGVGVATAGGVTGASAAITSTIYTNMDRKKVETILQEHCTQIEEIEKCVKFISRNIEGLKKYNLSTLKGVDWKAMTIARMAHKLGDSIGAIGAVSKSSGPIQGFTLGMDIYFSKEDSEALTKGSETTFAKQIRMISKYMQTSLDELMAFKTAMDSECT